MTIAEFERLPESDHYLFELDGGVLVREPRPGGAHGGAVINIGFALRRYADGQGGAVVSETGFVLDRAREIVRGPDVAWLRPGRVAYRLPDGFIEGAPDLAVEVLSPSNRARDIREKVAQYIDAGAAAVWVVDPRAETVTVHAAGRPERTLGSDHLLDGDDVLPGFRSPVHAFFRL